MERFFFNGRAQNEGEDFENFLSDIRIRAQTCKFCDMCEDSMIRDRIVLGVNSEETREELLKIRNLDLTKYIDICRAEQSAHSHRKALEPDTVHRVRTHHRERRDREQMRKCKYCGTAHIFEKKSCPAYGKTCDKCGKPNHFMSQCMSRSENGIRKQRATNYR
ncbi:hypothetical protein LSH36_151g07073 [Paralvinella palmiformis]|uniref:CCHC-type domain-containing protein n=1 Tax=Paralvinella palmiformis TaxID=53620 RepID=A0AAD9N7D4_9ANNE|nr:hypothetical protein LSH36_151g07073 [Paralvinella palmiformis]